MHPNIVFKIAVAFVMLPLLGFAQQNSLSIGTNQINNKAVLWLVPNASGQGLLLPVVSTSVRNGMGLQATDRGMIVYDSNDNSVYLWNGTAWNTLAGGSATTFTGANGITITGNTISTDAIRPTTSATGDLSGTFANPQIANNAVTTAKIANGAVDDSKIAGVSPGKISQSAATNGQVLKWNGSAWAPADDLSVALTAGAGINIAGSVITNTGLLTTSTAAGDVTGTFANLQITNGAITDVKLADNSVTTAKIANNAVIASKIADGNVTTNKIADNSISTAKIQDANITTAKIADGAVTDSKITTGIAVNKLTPGTAGQVLTVSGGQASWQPAPSGSVPTLSNGQILIGNGTANSPATLSGDATLAAGALTISNNAVTTSKIANDAVTTAKILDANVTNVKLANNSVDAAKIADGAVTDAKIATGIAVNKLTPGTAGQVLTVSGGQASWQPAPTGSVPTLSDGQILIGNGTANSPATLSGDATLSAGALTIATSAATGANVISAINAATAATINTARLNAGVVLETESPAVGDITGNFSTGLQIAANAVTTAEINNTAVTDAKIAGMSASKLAGTVAVANGGTGLATAPSNGQLLIGNGTGYTLAPLAAGAGINIANAPGSITISSTGLTNPMNLDGDIIYGGSGGTPTRLTAGIGFLRGGSPPAYSNVNLASPDVTGILPVTNGGTGRTTWNGVVYGSGGTLSDISSASAGQVFLSSATTPSWQTMTGDATINQAGILTLSNSLSTGNNVITAINSGNTQISGVRVNPVFGTQNISTTGTLTTGSTGQFTVNGTGNITRINNIATSFPATQGAANSVLTNDGAGNLSWAAGSGWGLTGNTLTGTERIGSDNPQPLVFETDNTERMRITPTGNVGIGTPTPTGRLGISGGELQLENLGVGLRHFSGSVALGSSVTATAGGVGTLSNHPFSLFTNGLDRMTILPSGNVGVGTVSPTAALEVNSPNTALRVTTTSSSAGNYAISATHAGTGNDVAGFFNASNPSGGSNAHGIYTVAEGAGSGIYAANNGSGSAAIFNNFNGGNSSPVVRIMNNGPGAALVTDLGFVGIGTPTPATRLDVNGSIRSNTNLSIVDVASATEGGQLILGYPSQDIVGEADGTFNIDVFSQSGQNNMRFFSRSLGGVIQNSIWLNEDGSLRLFSDLRPNDNPGTIGQVLTSAGPGLPPTWSSASGWGLTGNLGTVDGTNFIGTRDNVPLTFRVNDQRGGRIESSGTTANTFLGYQAGNVNTGIQNAAFGYQAMLANSSGGQNVAFGHRAMASNTTGAENTAIGRNALTANVTGIANTAVGSRALSSSTGNDNTAIGADALVNATGNANVAIGTQAGTSMTSANNNAALGAGALFATTTGSFNVAAGNTALSNNTTGVGNSALGHNAEVATGGLVNATAIGFNAMVSASNSMVLGSINGVNGATANTRVGIGTTSPTSPLQVTAQDGDVGPANSGTAANGSIRVSGGTNGVVLDVGVADDLYFGSYLQSHRPTDQSINSPLLLNPNGGNVGVGTTTPNHILHVNNPATAPVWLNLTNGSAPSGLLVGLSGAGSQEAFISNNQNTAMYLQTNGSNRVAISPVGNVGIGTINPTGGRLDVSSESSTTLNLNVNAVTTVTAFNLVRFTRNGALTGNISESLGTVSYNAFTGSHYAFSNEAIRYGELTTLTGKNKMLNDESKEVVYSIAPSSVENDPKLLGSYLSPLNEMTGGDIHQVMAVGNGEVWVIDTGKDLEIGDYLISSAIRGHAKIEDGSHEVAYVFARVAAPIRWKEITETIDGLKHAKVSIFYESFIKNNKAIQLEKEIESMKADIEYLKQLIGLQANKKD
jgi:hypothetical protein